MGKIARQSPKAIPNNDKDKNKNMKLQFLTVNSVVEVTSDEEGFKGAWYVAKILKPYVNRKPRFLIEYENLLSEKDSDQLLRETVDGSFIRPAPPPPAADEIYEVNDVVDAFHRDGWWKGVVSKVESRKHGRKLRRRYTVEFENPPEKLKFNGNVLRFHFDWIDGKWIQTPKKKVLLDGAHAEEQSAHVSLKAGSSTADNDDDEEKSSVKKSRKNPAGESSTFCATSASTNLKTPAPEPEETLPNSADILSPRQCFLTLMPITKCSTFDASRNLELAGSNSPKKGKCSGPNEQEAGSEDGITESSKKRKRELDAQVTGQQVPTAAGEETINVETFNPSAEVNGQVPEPVTQPFIRTSYMWKHIDSLEIFRILPQHPHFNFLADCNEETREGSAIGHMLTFASMAEKVTKLQIDDPMSRFDSYVEALAILEEIGFDAKVVADRLNELLALKKQHEQLKNQSKRYQTLLADCDGRKAKLEQEIAEIDRMTTSDLVMQRALKVSEMGMEDSNRGLVQFQVSSVKVAIFDVEHKFKVRSAAPWQRVI
ncbi:DUF724 domain-containing protein 7-like [Euphorbia lathyris]|uniref:DUF724 domain-containing protein 7-like n=1 Tax=Euphorbia lathyris TaxID=212925 RepID=UPI0033142A2B